MAKNLAANAGDAGDLGFTPGSRSSPGEGDGNLPQDSCLKISWTRGPDEPQSRGSEESDMIEQADHTNIQFIYSPQISTCIIFIFEQENIHLLVLVFYCQQASFLSPISCCVSAFFLLFVGD